MYTRHIGLAARAPSGDQSIAERCWSGGIHPTRNQASKMVIPNWLLFGTPAAEFVYSVLTQKKGDFRSGMYCLWETFAAAIVVDDELTAIG